MLRHSEWRKLAKKSRRKRIRQVRAQERDKKLAAEQSRRESSPTYQEWLKEQQVQEQREALEASQNEAKWRRIEEEAQRQWRELQKKIAIAREEKAKQNMKIKEEWEREQQRLKEEKEKKEKEIEEKRQLQEQQEKNVLDFIENGGSTPEHLKGDSESNPGKTLCPFFQKTSACRFFDSCSRNHVRPAVSKILLIKNFYSHYSLETKETEHGSDASLEYEKDETYVHYKSFFKDVVSEMEKFGTIRQFKTCCNHELHLRGNVYVEYSSTREALATYRKFNGRWYAGKQLNVEFCNIPSWKTAICGLHFKNRCPKGNSCNFLHVFKNPGNLYSKLEESSRRSQNRPEPESEHSWGTPDRRDWRWSESPEYIGRNGNKSDEEFENSAEQKARHSSTKEKRTRRSRDKRPSSRALSQKSRSRSRKRLKSKMSSSSRRKRSRSTSKSTNKS